MLSGDIEGKLHDRATRGEALSSIEQAQLEDWYASQDRAEMSELGLPGTAGTVESLQAQVDAALTQLAAVTRRIQEIAQENEVLRLDIAGLHRQLAQRAAPQRV